MSFPPPETAPCSLSSERVWTDKLFSVTCASKESHRRQPAIFRQLTYIPHTAKLELCFISTATTRLYMCISKGTLTYFSESDLCLNSD